MDEKKCLNHPEVKADFSCKDCAVPLCKTCCFPQDDGTSLCPQCMKKKVKSQESPVKPEIAEGTMCSTHNNNPAQQICQKCQSPMCNTCDFSFPNNVHVCPNCVNKTNDQTPGQKKKMIWSMVLAGIATLGYPLILFSMAWLTKEGFEPRYIDAIVGGLLLAVILAPGLTGLAFAVNSLPRGKKKTGMMWTSLIWNSLIITPVLFLLTIGRFILK